MSTSNNTLPLAIGIDMGGTSVKYGVVRGAEILATGEPIITGDFKGPKALVAEMTRRVHQLRGDFPGVEAVGIGVPGGGAQGLLAALAMPFLPESDAVLDASLLWHDGGEVG